jgi:hypothetical protein
MATTTTNFGWDIPQSTDLVKDGATAIAALGQDIDTALIDLKGGTTGQVLAKASGTDLDFSWVAQDDSNAIQNAIVDAKGDLIGATANDTPARLAVGTNGQVLTADSAEATGLKWATPAAATSGLTLIKSQVIGTGVSSIAVTSAFSSTYDNYKIMISGGTSSANNSLYLQLGSTVTGYYAGYTRVNYSTGAASLTNDNNGTSFTRIGSSNTNGMHSNFDILSPNLAKNTFIGGAFVDPATASSAGAIAGFLNDTTAYTGFTILMNTGNLTGGTIRVYGYQNS